MKERLTKRIMMKVWTSGPDDYNEKLMTKSYKVDGKLRIENTVQMMTRDMLEAKIQEIMNLSCPVKLKSCCLERSSMASESCPGKVQSCHEKFKSQEKTVIFIRDLLPLISHSLDKKRLDNHVPSDVFLWF